MTTHHATSNALPCIPRLARCAPFLAAVLLTLVHGQALPARPAPVTAAPTAPSQAADDQRPIAEVRMFAGETRVIPQRNAGRLAVGDGKILSAAVLDDREILLIANAPGDTTLHIWTNGRRGHSLKITVLQHDMARVTRDLQAFLGGMANVATRTIGDNVVIEGENVSDSDRDKIAELAKRFPQVIDFTSRVGFDRMFAFDVRFVEISRSGLKDLGLDWTTQGRPLLGFGIAGDLYHHNGRNQDLTRNLDDNGNTSEVTVGASKAPLAASLSIVGALFGRLNLLAQKGDAVLLAQPRLTARNRGSANFLAGGEIPIATASATGTPNISFKEYGIKLDIVEPVADDSGTIRARIKTEVSMLDRSVAVLGVPGLLSRRTETEFNLREGETLALSGVINHDQSKDATSVPYIGEIPVLGRLFRSDRFQNRQSELVVFVTPWIVRPGQGVLAEQGRSVDERVDRTLNPPPPPPRPARAEPRGPYPDIDWP